MSRVIKISCEDTRDEILARIAKAAARKFDCSLEIDFSDGRRTIEFKGREEFKPRIAREVDRIFKRN